MRAHVFAAFLTGMAEAVSITMVLYECSEGTAAMAVAWTLVTVVGIWGVVMLCRGADCANAARSRGAAGDGGAGER